MIQGLTDYIENNCAPVTYVTLVGQIVVCGFNTRSLDASRDLCALHLHLKTGGVFVRRDDSLTYLSPSVISHADLDPTYERKEEGADKGIEPDAKLQADASVPKTSLSREDEILAEMADKDAPVKARRKIRK